MATYRVWPATDGPASSVTDNQQLTLAMEFAVSTAAWVTHLHFWRGDTSVTGTITGRIWRAESAAAGTLMTADATFTLSGTGWHTVALATPLALEVGRRYKVAVTFPNRWTLTGGYWTSGPGAAGITNGILTARSAADGINGQGSYTPGPADTYPTTSGVGGNYWVDVTVTDTDPTGGTPQTLTPDGIAPTTVVGSPMVTPGAVTLTPAGITPTITVGSPTVVAGPVTLTPAGIVSTAAVGAPTITPGPVTLTPTGIPSIAQVGAPDVTRGAVVLTPTGIPPTTVVGSPTVTPGPVTIAPAGIPSTTQVGSPTLTSVITPTGIPPATVVGTPTVTPGPVTLTPAGIPSTTVVGIPAVTTEGGRAEALLLSVGHPRVDWTIGPLEVSA